MSDKQRLASIKKRADKDAPPKVYRLFLLDASGKITGFEVISAADDAAALEIARAINSSVPQELWDAERLVAKLCPPSAQCRH